MLEKVRMAGIHSLRLFFRLPLCEIYYLFSAVEEGVIYLKNPLTIPRLGKK